MFVTSFSAFMGFPKTYHFKGKHLLGWIHLGHLAQAFPEQRSDPEHFLHGLLLSLGRVLGRTSWRGFGVQGRLLGCARGLRLLARRRRRLCAIGDQSSRAGAIRFQHGAGGGRSLLLFSSHIWWWWCSCRGRWCCSCFRFFPPSLISLFQGPLQCQEFSILAVGVFQLVLRHQLNADLVPVESQRKKKRWTSSWARNFF